MTRNREVNQSSDQARRAPAVSDLDSYVEEIREQLARQAEEQYSETVLRHWRQPQNPGAMDNPDGHACITGPCGDTMELFLRVRERRVVDASFRTDGCTPSVVSGSMAVELALGKTITEVMTISQDNILAGLGGLPEESRHCALLASRTLRQAAMDFLDTDKQPWKKAYRLPRALS